jgi:hypothetical protein
MLDLRQHILSFVDTVSVPVEVPEWQCVIYCKTWTLAERQSFLDQYNSGEKASLGPVLIASCFCTEDGKRIFNPEDLEALSGKRAVVLDRLSAIALTHNGISKDGSADVKKK